MKAVFVCFGLAVWVAAVSAQMNELMLMNMLMQGGNSGSGSTSTGTGSGSALGMLGAGGATGTAGATGTGNRLSQAAALAAMSRGNSRGGMFGRGLGSLMMMRNMGMDQYMEFSMCMRMFPPFLCANRLM